MGIVPRNPVAPEDAADTEWPMTYRSSEADASAAAAAQRSESAAAKGKALAEQMSNTSLAARHWCCLPLRAALFAYAYGDAIRNPDFWGLCDNLSAVQREMCAA